MPEGHNSLSLSNTHTHLPNTNVPSVDATILKCEIFSRVARRQATIGVRVGEMLLLLLLHAGAG